MPRKPTWSVADYDDLVVRGVVDGRPSSADRIKAKPPAKKKPESRPRISPQDRRRQAKEVADIERREAERDAKRAYMRGRRRKPPIQRQTKNNDCWAAALASWAAFKHPPKPATHYYEELKRNYPTEYEKGADIAWIINTASSFGAAFVKVSKWDVTKERLEDMLDERGPVLLSYRIGRGADGDTWWHLIVLYDVDDRGNLLVMDPAEGYVVMSFTYPFWSHEYVWLGRSGPPASFYP